MTTAITTQEEAQKIWDELDREESGSTSVAPPQESEAAVELPAAENHNGDVPAEQQEAQPSPESQALMDRIAGLESMLQQTAQRLRNAEGHIGGLNSQLKQQVEAAKQVVAAGGEAPSASQIREAQRSSKAMETLRRDYPEFADAMDAALNERIQEALKQVPQPQVQPAAGVAPEDLVRLEREFAVEVRHPGWKETVRQPAFRGWMQRQPREVQMLATSDSPQDAVRLLDLYAQTNDAVQRTQRLSSAAAIPSGRSSGAPRTKSIEEMTPQEYWRYLDEIDRQKG